MFEQFSRSYYLGRLYVQPAEADAPAMCKQQCDRVREQLYDHSEATPLVMKLGSRHFPVAGDESIPRDTLAVPPGLLSDAPVDNPPSLSEVFLATEDRADQLLALAGVSEADPAGI